MKQPGIRSRLSSIRERVDKGEGLAHSDAAYLLRRLDMREKILGAMVDEVRKGS